jgi:hypothetical protein
LTTSTSISNLIRSIAGVMFACGVMGLLFWQVVTIYPGSEYKFLVVCGLLLLSGLLRREWHYRIAAIVLGLFCTLAAIDSRSRGLAYEQRVKARRATHAQPR